MVKLKYTQRTQKRKRKIKIDNTYNKTSGDIIAVLSLLMYQQTLRNKSVEELRYIVRHAFNVDNAVEMTKEELIAEIIKARAKMLEPKKKKKA